MYKPERFVSSIPPGGETDPVSTRHPWWRTRSLETQGPCGHLHGDRIVPPKPGRRRRMPNPRRQKRHQDPRCTPDTGTITNDGTLRGGESTAGDSHRESRAPNVPRSSSRPPLVLFRRDGQVQPLQFLRAETYRVHALASATPSPWPLTSPSIHGAFVRRP